MARHLIGNTHGDEVVGLYPHMYSEQALGEKGFEMWFLVFEDNGM